MKKNFISALGMFTGIVIVILISNRFDFPAIYAPLGATAFLVFVAPGALFAQPANIIFGNTICCSIAVLFMYLHFDAPILIAFATALASFLMLILRVPHPPAAGIPLMFLLYHPESVHTFLSVIVASFIIVIAGLFYHRLAKNDYPINTKGGTRL